MHEMSLAESIVDIVERTAAANGGGKVSAVRLAIGARRWESGALEVEGGNARPDDRAPAVSVDLQVAHAVRIDDQPASVGETHRVRPVAADDIGQVPGPAQLDDLDDLAAVLDDDVALLELGSAGPKAFHLPTLQCQAGFILAFDEIVVPGLAVLGDRGTVRLVFFLAHRC